MPIQDSRAEYAARMHRVQAHIDDHLDRPLDLAGLARVANFSDFHFHRLFAAWMGETLGDYVRRRRLETAALRLVAQPHLGILEAALSVGWGSGEAFARAFRSRFGCSPSQWRDDAHLRNLGQADRKIGQAGDPHAHEHGDSIQPPEHSMTETLDVRLIDRAPTRIAYLRHVGPYGDGVHAFWARQVVPWMRANALLAAPRYGISHDDPSITDPARCRYDAGAEVGDGFVAGTGVFTTTIPGGRYASLAFDGTSEEVGAAWQALLRRWLPDSGLQLDARPCFEFYPPDARYDEATGRFECRIVVPVAPL